MGNSFGKVSVCFTGAGKPFHHHNRRDDPVILSEPYDEGLGHSFCYVRPDPTWLASSNIHSESLSSSESTTFKTISGASVSANTSTPLSTALIDLYSYNNSIERAAAFESSTSFASIPLQPIPRSLAAASGPISFQSGPLERGFLSGPIERAFMSGPLDRAAMFSGPMEKAGGGGYSEQFQRSFSHGGGLGLGFKPRSGKKKLIRVLQRAISRTIYRGQNSILAPIKNRVVSVKDQDWVVSAGDHHKQQTHNENLTVSSVNFSSEGSLEDDESLMMSQNLQWAQGKAGEDRVHVVVSEEDGWVFVGIYDGFNGPDAPDYLLSNLYTAVHKELKGVIWDDKVETAAAPVVATASSDHQEVAELVSETNESGRDRQFVEEENYPCASDDVNSRKKEMRSTKTKYRGGSGRKWEDNHRRWRCEWDRERVELDRRLKEQLNRCSADGSSVNNHSDVLKALSQALRKTEEAYLDVADKMLLENPELALMGSCVLVMLMKGEDVYVMNVGDSRVVLGQKAEPDYWLGKIRQDLERINEETLHDLEDGDRENAIPNLSAVQLTMDHSTSELEEVHRIRNEHPEDACAVMNDRVKGSLKVTRAFGAGFLKQPKWNNALLEAFQIDYIGTSPYISCLPYLHHHRLGPKDRFLLLSSDGLYQYFTNEEAVSEVELFITLQPEGDPAQHLVEEVLFRAAKKAGMDFHELLQIPQGDRRRYHDDVSIIVISLEGRIWRSCV